MSFLKIPPRVRLAAPPSVSQPITETSIKTVLEVDDDGNEIEVVRTITTNVFDPDNKINLPSPEEYSLENLLKAGVPLQEVNVSDLVSNYDMATVGDWALRNAESLRLKIEESKNVEENEN